VNIGFFLQNNKIGGLDTFLINLLSNWIDKKDKLILFCNSSHPGFYKLKKKFDKFKCINMIGYKIPLAQDIILEENILNKIYRKFFIIKNINKNKKIIYNLLKAYSLDKLVLIQGGYPGGESTLSATLAWNKLSKKKVIFNFHNFARKKKFWDLYRLYFDYKISQNVNYFISVSKSCARSIYNIKQFSKIKSYFVYNGLDPKNFKNIIRKKNTKQKIILLMLGVYEARKGHNFLFKVLSNLNKKFGNFECKIYGYGSKEEIKNIKQNIPKKIQNKINLFNHVENIQPIINNSDIILVTSQEQESFCYAALEAMALKKPVVSTNVGGLPEVVKNNYSGYVIEKNNINKFSERILELINSYKKRKTFGETGKKIFLKKFNSKFMTQKYYKLIKNG